MINTCFDCGNNIEKYDFKTGEIRCDNCKEARLKTFLSSRIKEHQKEIRKLKTYLNI